MLLRYLKIDVRRAFGNWRFPICVIIISVLLLYNKDEPADVVSWMNHVNTMQLLFIAMGIASVPYVGSYINFGFKWNCAVIIGNIILFRRC